MDDRELEKKVFVYDCDICQDTGFVDKMEAVYPGEPHMANIGKSRCICSFTDDDNDWQY